MKITFVLIRPGLDGGTRVIATYADRLQRRGHDVVVVSTPRRPGTLRDYARAVLGRRQWPRPSRPGNPSHLDSFPLDHRRIERFRPVTDTDVPDADVVVATWWETAHWIAALSPEKGAKAFFVQGFETWGGQAQRVEAAWRLPLQKIVISRWLLDLARDRFGDQQAVLVPNGVDLHRFSTPSRGRQVRPTVGLVYSSVPIKGGDIMFSAIAQVRRSIPDLRVVAFGASAPAAELPLPPDTEYHQRPPQEELAGLYAACDVWLFASRMEGFGLPLLEAMACRTPVVATPAGAAPQLLAAGGGILVKPEDPTDMARGIIEILHLPETRWRQMSDTAHATAARYTWDDATDLFEAALARAIERPAGPLPQGQNAKLSV